MSIGTVLILVFAIAALDMHLRGQGDHGIEGQRGCHTGHGAGPGGGCGGTHAGNSTVVGVSDTTTVGGGETADPGPSGASDHQVHGHG